MVITLCFFEIEYYSVGVQLLGTAHLVSGDSVQYPGTPDKLQNVAYFIIY